MLLTHDFFPWCIGLDENSKRRQKWKAIARIATKKKTKQARDLSSDDENEQIKTVKPRKKKTKQARDLSSDDENEQIKSVKPTKKKTKQARDLSSDDENEPETPKKRPKKSETNDGTPTTYVQEKAAYGKRLCSLARIAVNDVCNMCGLCYMTSLQMFKRTTRWM